MINNEFSPSRVSIETQNSTTTLYQNRPTQILVNTVALAVLALGGLGLAAFASGVAVTTPLFASAIGATVIGSSVLLHSSYKAVNAYRERARASNFATPLIKESLEDARNESEVSHAGVELTDEFQIDPRSVSMLSNTIDLTEQISPDSSGETDKSQEAATNNIELDGKSHGAYAGYYATAKRLAFYAIPVLGVVATLAATYYYFGGNANNTGLNGQDVCPNDPFHNLKEICPRNFKDSSANNTDLSGLDVCPNDPFYNLKQPVCPSNFEASNGNAVSLVEDGLNSIWFKNETGSMDVNSDISDMGICPDNFVEDNAKASNENLIILDEIRGQQSYLTVGLRETKEKIYRHMDELRYDLDETHMVAVCSLVTSFVAVAFRIFNYRRG
ncbi:MAG: hypothetical protein WAM28_00785 [Chlamydiales bacterium]